MGKEPKTHRHPHRKANVKLVERVIVESAPSEEVKLLVQLVKETDARSRVMFTKLHNLQVENTELKTSINKMAHALYELLDFDSTHTDAQAIIRDFLNHTKPKTI